VQAARAFDARKLDLDAFHADFDQAAIGLDLRFARAAKEAEAAPLTFKMGPGPDKAGLLVGKMSQFDLKRALPGTSPSAENLQDQTGSVDDFRGKRFFKVALLDGRQRAIHNHKVDFFVSHELRQIRDLPFPKETGRADLCEIDDSRVDQLKLYRAGEPGCFSDPGLLRAVAGRRCNLFRPLHGLADSLEIRSDHKRPGSTGDQAFGVGFQGQYFFQRFDASSS
jgi:hypothetical protein